MSDLRGNGSGCVQNEHENCHSVERNLDIRKRYDMKKVLGT